MPGGVRVRSVDRVEGALPTAIQVGRHSAQLIGQGCALGKVLAVGGVTEQGVGNQSAVGGFGFGQVNEPLTGLVPTGSIGSVLDLVIQGVQVQCRGPGNGVAHRRGLLV